MSIVRALRLSLEGTGNDAFRAASPIVEETVKAGDEIHEALARTHLFPGDFLRILEVAEVSGTLHDVLRHQSEHYHDQAARRLTFLTVLMGYAVWLMVAVVIIVAIFRIVFAYLGLIDQALNFKV
jgi:type IV pilus assembly protein PilC